MAENHLVIMAKLPQAGRVKTRLARDIGAAEAARVYRTVLGRTIRQLSQDPRWHTWIAVAPDTAVGSPVWPPQVGLLPQGAGTLGRRMQHVFNILPSGRALIIGSDVPGIRQSDIAEAFVALGDNDAVFGPASDGGFWLVGLRRMPKVLDIFAGIRWSSEHALEDTLANLKGRKAAHVRQLDDLDTAADYRRWRTGGLQV